MQTYFVYPKKGAMFKIECSSLEDRGNVIVVHDDSSDRQGFLWRDRLAAIIQERQPSIDERDLTVFCVMLKGHSEAARVSVWKVTAEPKIVFKTKALTCSGGNVGESEVPIKEFYYINLSQVVAIVPADVLSGADGSLR